MGLDSAERRVVQDMLQLENDSDLDPVSSIRTVLSTVEVDEIFLQFLNFALISSYYCLFFTLSLQNNTHKCL